MSCRKTTAIVFFLIGIVLLSTIATPLAILYTAKPVFCSSAESLKPDEQMICDDVSGFKQNVWTVEYSESAKNYVKLYLVDQWRTLTTVERIYDSPSLSVNLNQQYHFINISVVKEAHLYLNMSCTSEDIDIYIITKDEYEAAGGKKGKFDGSKLKRPTIKRDKCLSDKGGVFDTAINGPNYWYMVFSNVQKKNVTVTYQYNLTYTVYNLSSYAPINDPSENKYYFNKTEEGEAIILDYDYNATGPEVFDAKIFDIGINWPGIIASAVVLGFFTIVSFIVAYAFTVSYMKHEGYSSMSDNDKACLALLCLGLLLIITLGQSRKW